MVNNKKFALILFILTITNFSTSSFSKHHVYSEKTCKDIYVGIGYFLKEANKLWKKSGSSNDRKALMYSQAAANYTTVYNSFCKHGKRKPKKNNESKKN